MMLMGYDEDSYDQEQNYVMEDDSMTDEQKFKEQKKQYAAELKQQLMYGKARVAQSEPEYDEEDFEPDEDGEYGSSVEEGE